jgi:thiol:disulfide interchange protein/DsbC/DsbD-like thiol-disulfide interchange protein
MTFHRMILLLFAILAATRSVPADAMHARTAHVEAELVTDNSSVAAGQFLDVALHQSIMPGWHTYWRNPGDAGTPTTIAWTLPAGWRAGEIIWPRPERSLFAGSLMTFGYSDDVYMPVRIAVPAEARPGALELGALVSWLVCKDVCIPEQVRLTLPIRVTARGTVNPPEGSIVANAIASAPKPAGLKAAFVYVAKDKMVKLEISGSLLKGKHVSSAYFLPYANKLLDLSKPQVTTQVGDALTLALAAGDAFSLGRAPSTLDGVLDLGPDQAIEISAASMEAPPADPYGLVGALFFGFLGGVILNLMPCVFPVLSMKAAALARHVKDPGQARVEGLAFMLGSVTTFVGLAAALIFAQHAGHAIGWGFQLQSPAVVAMLTLLMLAVALNLSGVFEIRLPVQGAGQGLTAKAGMAGAFFTGALAVVVAAPCTAPFMAGAIGWAFTQPPAAALAVFVALGVGLATPLTMVAFLPGLFKFLPRPGGWMEGLRKTLAFPMYGSAAWLAWVFVQQTGPNGLALLFAAALFVAYALWLCGTSQRAARPWLPRLGALAAFAAAVPLVISGQALTIQAWAQGEVTSTIPGVGSQAWSPDRVDALRRAGRTVFVDFTAAWCITCQVNERTTLASAVVANAFKHTNAVYLKADWTNYNPEISKTLTSLGRAGVPLYLVYSPDSNEPRVLPQILTQSDMVAALDGAAASPPSRLASNIVRRIPAATAAWD